MFTKKQWELRLGMYKTGMIDLDDIYTTIAEQCAAASNGAKPIVSGALPLDKDEITAKAIVKSMAIDTDKYDGKSFRVGYIAGYEDAQRNAVGGNDR